MEEDKIKDFLKSIIEEAYSYHGDMVSFYAKRDAKKRVWKIGYNTHFPNMTGNSKSFRITDRLAEVLYNKSN